METQQPTSHKQILSQTNQVIKSNSRVFLSLSLLFLSPLAAATVLFPALQYIPSVSTAAKILLFLGLSFSSLILSSSAVGSISFAALCGLSGEKPSLSASLKSLSSSFHPLLFTVLLYQSILFSATVAYALITSFYLGRTNYDRDHDHRTADISSFYAIVFNTALFLILVMYLQVNWSLAYPVAAFESAKGFKALKRSKDLVRGERWLALSLGIIFGIYYLMAFWCITLGKVFAGTFEATSDSDWRNQLISTVATFLFSAGYLALIQLYNMVATTVLYACCRKSELGGENFPSKYFSLTVNDENIGSSLA